MSARSRILGLTAIFIICLSNTACRTDLDAAGLDPAQFVDGIDPRQPNVERTTTSVNFTGIDTVRIELPRGKVTVTQAAGGAAAILKTTETILAQGLDAARLAERLTASGVSVQRAFVDHSRLDLEAARHAELKEEDIEFDVNLTLPIGANVEVLMNQGPVTVSKLTGSVEIRTVNGAIKITQVDGDVVAQTSGQSISAVDVTGDAQFETLNGNISLRLTEVVASSVSASTTDGDIAILVPADHSVALDLLAVDGFIVADLTGFTLQDISFGASHFSGLLNGGAGAIEARTTNGDIAFAALEK